MGERGDAEEDDIYIYIYIIYVEEGIERARLAFGQWFDIFGGYGKPLLLYWWGKAVLTSINVNWFWGVRW